MAGSDVFLAGTTGATLIRSIYEPGSQGTMAAWASQAGLATGNGLGLANTNNLLSVPSLADSSSSVRTIRKVLDTAALPQALLGQRPELLVDKPAKRLKGDEFAMRLWSTHVPSGAFVPIGNHLSVCSPEFLFVQRSVGLGLIQTISYGNELCGLYSIDDSERGFNDHSAFSTRAILAAFLSDCRRGKGTQLARIAIKWVADRCRSPKESDTYLLTCLPRDYGGYGILERPRINSCISVPENLWYLTRVRSYEVDLLWERSRAVAEYDGVDHDTPEQRLRDDTKTHVLEEMGYLVIRITRDILNDPVEFDRRMRLLGKRLGTEVPLTSPEFVRKRSALRRALFSPESR